MRHDFTGGTFDRHTRDRLTGHHRFLYVGHHQGVAYYVPTTVGPRTTSADYAHVRRLGRIGLGEVFALSELCERFVGQFIAEYGPDRTADGEMRAGNDAPIEQADEAGATLSREHVRGAVTMAVDTGVLTREQANAMLRYLCLAEIEEPYKIVTVEVKIKTRDGHPVDYVRGAIERHIPVGMELLSFTRTGVEEVDGR